MDTYSDGTVKASNGVGWVVEAMTENGWQPTANTFPDKQSANIECEGFKKMWPIHEFRVYEALVIK